MAAAMQAATLHLDTLLNLLGTGFSVYSFKRSLQQQADLHEEEMATSTEQHFSSLSTELLAIAKEADRDVWEQRNNQFNNLLVCAVLMFGVAVGNINEGTYQYSKSDDLHGSEVMSLVSRDGLFTLLSGISMGAFFLCITACIIVMRRMSSYMIERSTNLVDRLAVTMEIAHGISSAAEAQHRDNVERLLGQEKGRFHDKLGAVIGSGPKDAHEERLAQTAVKASKGSLRKEVSDGGSSYRYVYVPPAVPNGSSDGLDRGAAPPNGGLAGSGAPPAHVEPNGGWMRRSATSPALLSRSAPLNFSIFYRDNCVPLAQLVMGSFVVGVVTVWTAVWLLLWNQFPHLYLPVFTFFVLFGFAIFLGFYVDWRSKKDEVKVARALREDVFRTQPPSGPGKGHTGGGSGGDHNGFLPQASPSANGRQQRRRPSDSFGSLQDLRAALLPSPPPSPPVAARLEAPTRRSSVLRLRELDALQSEGLISADEYTAKRLQILDTI